MCIRDRETELFTAEVIHELGTGVSYMVVSEAGASVYSASKLAAQEFPDFDVTLRSAVSIARRLQDPLAELVKIDPKAIGVGQYQHDMPPKRLNEALSGVVEEMCIRDRIDEGNTIPFIARYRKEAHGSLDDQTLREIAERLDYLRGLEKRCV